MFSGGIKRKQWYETVSIWSQLEYKSAISRVLCRTTLNLIMDLFSQKSPVNVWYGSECVSSFHSITNTERKLTGLPWLLLFGFYYFQICLSCKNTSITFRDVVPPIWNIFSIFQTDIINCWKKRMVFTSKHKSNYLFKVVIDYKQ